VRGDDLGRSAVARELKDDGVAALVNLRALCVDANVDAFASQNVCYGRRRILVLARDEPGCSLDHRHCAAKAPIYLGKFEANIAATDDQQMRWHEIDVQNGTVGEIVDFIQSGNIGYERTSTDIDKDLLRAKHFVDDEHLARRDEAGVADVDRTFRIASQRPLHTPVE